MTWELLHDSSGWAFRVSVDPVAVVAIPLVLIICVILGYAALQEFRA